VQTITPFLWFEDQAEEAVAFYLTLVDGEILDISRTPDGRAFVVHWRMGGVEYRAINGGPHYALSPAFSLYTEVPDQQRIDELWDALTADGGQESQCGWLVDRFGVSWQIAPSSLGELMQGQNGAAVTAVLMTQTKIVLADLEAASRG
jgi:predicted 3-demethylubiquinone-9 3-methyltransferase (glyoxalase superfamily)